MKLKFKLIVLSVAILLSLFLFGCLQSGSKISPNNLADTNKYNSQEQLQIDKMKSFCESQPVPPVSQIRLFKFNLINSTYGICQAYYDSGQLYNYNNICDAGWIYTNREVSYENGQAGFSQFEMKTRQDAVSQYCPNGTFYK